MNSAYHNCDYDGDRITCAEANSLRAHFECCVDERIARRYQSGVNDDNYTLGWYDATEDILQDYVFGFSDFETMLWREEIDKRFHDRIKFYIKTWSYAWGELGEDIMGFRRSVNKHGRTCWEAIDSKYEWMEFDKLSDTHYTKDTEDLFFIHIPTLFEVIVDRLNDKWEEEKAKESVEQPEEPIPEPIAPVKIPRKVVKKKAVRKETHEEFSKGIELKITEYNDMIGEINRGK